MVYRVMDFYFEPFLKAKKQNQTNKQKTSNELTEGFLQRKKKAFTW